MNVLLPVENQFEENNVYEQIPEFQDEINLIDESNVDLYDEIDFSDFEDIQDVSEEDESDECDEFAEFDDFVDFDENTEEIIYDHEPIFQQFLHPSLTTTKMEALQMILIFFIRHNLTFAALEDMLLLINSLIKVNSLPTTKYKFFKLFSRPYKPKYNFYCKNKFCGNLLTSSFDRNVRHNSPCNICGTDNNIDSKNEQYFITLPLQNQLQEIIQQNSEILTKNTINNTSTLKDIKDGELYKSFVNNKGNNNPKITLVMNTDGVQVFKSNNKGLWPIQVVINELPVDKRFLIKNILVLGLFYDRHHPKMQHFLQPLMMELIELNHTGNK